MPLISIKNLRKQYSQPTGEPLVVLDKLDCEIERGQFVSIIGPSGCGKSTLLNILGLLDVATSYDVLQIAEESIQSLSMEARTRFRGQNLGFIFQFHQLLPEFTALQNVLLPMQVATTAIENPRERAMSLLRKVFTESEMNDKIYTRKPAQLSGGQCQRVAIARALANDPPLILADEPTGSLDPKSSETVMNILEGLTDQGKTVLMITHQMSLAKQADQVLLVKDGYLHDVTSSLNETEM